VNSKLLRTASLCLVLLLACLYSGDKQTGVARSVPKQPGDSFSSQSESALVINITETEYENALARWRARSIEEYEITLADSTRMAGGGRLRLRIRVDNGEPILVSYTDLNGEQPKAIPVETLDAEELAFLRERSVEGMFGLIGEVFTGTYSDTGNVVNEYEIEFDNELGYASRVHSRVLLREGGITVTECCIYYDVIGVKILRTNTPGMPRSGNPGT
jgi:hypothetical protein